MFTPGLSLPPSDTDGSPLQRMKLTRTGWHFEPRLISFCTSDVICFMNCKPNGYAFGQGTDYGDATLKFFKSDGTAIVRNEGESAADFNLRLAADCTCTCMDWQPHYDMEIISGGVRFQGNSTKNAAGFLVFVPDIPEIYGGSVPFMTGGLPLRMIPEGEYVPFDGRTAKFMAYDPVYNSNKCRVKILHNTGDKIFAVVRFEHFKG